LSLDFFKEDFITIPLANIGFESFIFGSGQLRIRLQIDIPGIALLLRVNNVAQVEEVLLSSHEVVFDCRLNRGVGLVTFDFLLNEQEDLQEH
jgi:hypothetical protein